LRKIATIESIGSSTRIEGATLTDQEVKDLLKDLKITELKTRDEQEVIGYHEVLELIYSNYSEIKLSENYIKQLHQMLLKYSNKDERHRGTYKFLSNKVMATYPAGEQRTIFATTDPALVASEMKELVGWTNETLKQKTIHQLIVIGSFIYDFLSIHPFQDGNGRLSRLISTLLLLKNGYKWIQYVSFEHEIENRKNEYYQVLRSCQAQRPHEDVTVWIQFFLNCLSNIQSQLLTKLQKTGMETQLSPKEKSIYSIIQNRPNIQSGEIAEKLAIPAPTVKRILSELLNKGLIEKQGSGRNVSYTIK